MNRRLVLAVVAVGLLVGLAGCSILFGGISDEQLDEEEDYDDLRDRNETVAIDIEAGGYFIGSGEFRAVYDLEDQEEVSLYRSHFYRDRALDIHSVRYWYPNGTEVTGSELEVDQSRSSTEVVVPDGDGELAVSGSAGSRTFSQPNFVEGTYNVSLPPGYRSSHLLFGDVSPSGYDRAIVDDQEWLTWDEEVDSSLSIRYFVPRDLWLFGGFIGVVVILGGIGAGYFYVRLKRLRERRRELGIEVDIDEDDGPPPGLG